MGHNVLRLYHQLIGACDWHDLWVPAAPSATGVAPYVPFFPVLSGLTTLTAQWGATVDGQHSAVMQRGTDVGPFIYHWGAPNLFMPAMLLLSGSKSHFGTTQVLPEGKPAAVALVWIFNVNLDCCGPLKRPPCPTGIVPAWMTVEAAFTAGDFWAGVAHMGVDMALEWALNWVFFGIGKIPPIARALQSIYERALFRPLMAMLSRIPYGRAFNWLFTKHAIDMALSKGLAQQFPLTVASILFGSPVGGAPPFAPAGAGEGTTGLGEYLDEEHNAIRDHVNSNGVDEHPSSPPSDSGSTTGGPDAGVPDATDDAGSATGGGADAGVPDAADDAGGETGGGADAGPADSPDDADGPVCMPDDPAP
ncbi:MAG: hypothetical protein ACYTG0_07630 [Planctomycetota bacterium]|jgi:hypothetical protein